MVHEAMTQQFSETDQDQHQVDAADGEQIECYSCSKRRQISSEYATHRCPGPAADGASMLFSIASAATRRTISPPLDMSGCSRSQTCPPRRVRARAAWPASTGLRSDAHMAYRSGASSARRK